MNFFTMFFDNLLELANAMSIYIIFGVILAALLKEILPQNFIIKHLGDNNIKSVLKATILGIPMPVCSCSVIPLAKSLQKEGASKGAIGSFLISTPITGVDSIFATYSFFGSIFTIYRVVTSIIIALTAGILQNIFLPSKNIKKSVFSQFKPTSSLILTSTKECKIPYQNKRSFSLKRVFNYAFNSLFSDIAKSLFIGLLIGALFTTFFPKELLNNLENNLFLTYIIVIIISIPLYICATSSLPIAASLYLSGFPIGAVYIFLSAGPATNSVTISVVKDILGKKALLIYLFSIAFLSIIFGAILDISLSSLVIKKSDFIKEDISIINYGATFIMFLLIFYYWRKK